MRFWFGSCSPREGKKRQLSATLALLYSAPTGFKAVSEISHVPAVFSPDLSAGSPTEVNTTHPRPLYSAQTSKRQYERS